VIEDVSARETKMKTESIAHAIGWVNDGTYPDGVFFSPGEASVRHAKVWFDQPDGTDRAHGHDVWFIFSEAQCVGAVAVMGQQDLHAYTVESHRRKGLMFDALRTRILPALANAGTTEQRVSYQDDAGRRLARKLGAKEAKDGEAVIALAFFEVPEAKSAKISPPKKRRDAICKNLLKAAQILEMTGDELCQFGAENADLKYLADEVRSARYNLIDQWESLSDMAG
jgi:hypothetical protein